MLFSIQILFYLIYLQCILLNFGEYQPLRLSRLYALLNSTLLMVLQLSNEDAASGQVVLMEDLESNNYIVKKRGEGLRLHTGANR